MKDKSLIELPKLAAPGAGLPKPELFVARLIFGHFRKTQTRGGIQDLFESERDRILRLAKGCDLEAGARQVLIKRLPGMEDSSRNWSVYMTLEHLRIVNAAVRDVILTLAAGNVPPNPASTAAVKPEPGIDHSVLAAFENGCDRFLTDVAALEDLRTAVTYPHPWFGPLDAAAWHAMAAFHLRLHRKQIERIIAAQAEG